MIDIVELEKKILTNDWKTGTHIQLWYINIVFIYLCCSGLYGGHQEYMSTSQFTELVSIILYGKE